MDYSKEPGNLLVMISSLFNAVVFFIALIVVLLLIHCKVFPRLKIFLCIFIVYFITRGITDTLLYLSSKESYT